MAKIAFALYTAVIIYFSLQPVTKALRYLYHDKVLHFFCYFLLAILGVTAFNKRNQRPYVIAFAILLGIALEAAQLTVRTRHMSVADGITNIIGVFAGILIVRFFTVLSKRIAEANRKPRIPDRT